ncbi:MAG: ABC transporter substrate-binding protein [Spirochaetaceae bacterium]|jgi:putative ABC transport system substrate-binding protein|nr:ABC transporter substrate-binding protein [Spirochaetaceae bacterium]
MKKFCTGLVLALIALQTSFANGGKQADGALVIGISKILQHPALDACEQGVKDAIASRGITAVYDSQNANNDLSTAAQIANKFNSEKVAVAVGIATPAAQALANALKTIPVVFTAVTDPVAAGLVVTVAHGENNVTGASDAIPTAKNIALFKEIAGIKTLGYIYTSSESNSIAELELVTQGAASAGLTLVTQTVNTTAEVKQAAQAIAGRVDGLYMSTDNTVFTALPAVIEVFRTAKKPIFAGDASGAKDGGCMIASGSNYYKLGLATGNIVADILGGKKPSEIPVKFATEPSELDFLVDLDAAANCGITIPQKYIDQATMIFENGKLTEKTAN